MPLPLLAIAGAGILAKGLTGIVQGLKARKLDKQNPFPTENANPIFQKNAAIAENMARTGLPQQQYNNALNNIQRNTAGVLTSFGRSGNKGGLASILRGSNDAVLNLDAQDANARMQNQRFAFGQRTNLAQEENRVFDWNKRQKFLMLKTQSEALKGAGMQNLMGAFNDTTQLGAMGLMGQNQSQATGGNELGYGDTTQNWWQKIAGGGKVKYNQIPKI